MFERPTTTASSPGEIAQPILQQHDAAERRAGYEAFLPDAQPPDIDDVEAVHILVRVDRGDHHLLVDMLGQRQLDEDAVHRRIGVEHADQRQQLVLRRRLGQAVGGADHARRLGRLALGTDIDLARRVLADDHHRQPRLAPRRRLESGDQRRHAFTQRRRERLAVDDVRRHAVAAISEPKM